MDTMESTHTTPDHDDDCRCYDCRAEIEYDRQLEDYNDRNGATL